MRELCRRSLTAVACMLSLLNAAPANAQISRLDGAADKELAAKRNAKEEDLRAIAVIDRKVMVPMRDGTRLATDIYRPKDASKRYPTIFVRTPYNVNYWDTKLGAPADQSKALEAVKRGYAYVVQNERGQYFSEGDWQILGAPRTDGYDSFSWIAEQPWSNGKLAPWGCSSLGEWHMGVAALGHPAQATMVTQGFGAGIGRVGPFLEQGGFYRGGAIQMEMILFLYESQNRQRPMFPNDLSQADRTRLSKYFDLQAQWPGVDWEAATRHLPVSDIIRHVEGPKGIFADPQPGPGGKPFVERTPADPAWSEGGLYQPGMKINLPTLWMASWYDLSTAPNIELFNKVVTEGGPEIARQQKLIISPVKHCQFGRESEHTAIGDLDAGDARFDYDALIWGWLDHYLKGDDNGMPDKLSAVTYYTLGMNRWRTSPTWPPAGAKPFTLFLSSGGKANSLSGDGVMTARPPPTGGVDRFVYDPMNPVPSVGGRHCCLSKDLKAGAFDQRGNEGRPDVLVYTSEPLAKGLDASGPIEVELWVSSDRPDTDFTVKLLDVYPDGRAFNLDETIQRARYREGYDKPIFMQPGMVYRVKLGPMVTSNWFAPGHRIRLEVSSSNFPNFERNLNTGGRNTDEVQGVKATNTVHHSSTYPSKVTLTVAP